MKAGFRGGASTLRTEHIDFSEAFSAPHFDGTLEAALLLKSTGIALASWTRTPVPQEVVSVMAATLWGSLDTLIRTLGAEAPRSAYLELEAHRMFVTLVEPNWTLLLIGPRSVGKRRLRQEAARIVERIARVRNRTVPRRDAVGIQG